MRWTETAEPKLWLHCNLYVEYQANINYEEFWDELVNKQETDLESHHSR